MTDVERIRHQKFLRLLMAHEPAVRAYLRRLVPTRADADDAMQETAVILWEKFDEFRDGGDFRAWAFGIARFKALSWARDRGRSRLVLAADVLDQIARETDERESVLDRQRAALETCVDKLPPEHRDLLMAAYQPKARMQEIADAGGRTIAGFYQWLYRIRQLLLECVQRELGEQVKP